MQIVAATDGYEDLWNKLKGGRTKLDDAAFWKLYNENIAELKRVREVLKARYGKDSPYLARINKLDRRIANAQAARGGDKRNPAKSPAGPSSSNS